MRFSCHIARSGADWIVRHDGPAVGTLQVRAASREEALEKIRNEIRYRLELCPCSGESYQFIQIEIVDENSAK
jgi:hypothetical protein